MPTGFYVEDFDRTHERLKRDNNRKHAVTQDERYRIAQLSRTHVQARLRAILDAPETIVTTGSQGELERVTVPALEAMTRKMVDMVLGKGEFVGVKDHTRVMAYKAVCERVLGAPQQYVHHSGEKQADNNEDLDALTPEALKALEYAHESVFAREDMPFTKSL